MKNVKNFSTFTNESKSEDEDKKDILFKAFTKGGKWGIEVTEDETSHGKYYDIKQTKNDRTQGMASRTGKLAVVDYLVWEILGSKDVDSINYAISIDKLGVKKELEKFEKVYKTWYSKEFKDWKKGLTKENAEKFEKGIKEKAEKAVEKDNIPKKHVDDYCRIIEKEYLTDKFTAKKD